MMQASLNNPDFIRNMMNPATMRAAMQMRNSLGGNNAGVNNPFAGGMGLGAMPPPPAPANPVINGLDFSNLLSNFGATRNVSAGQQQQNQPNAAQQPPAVRFAPQLRTLNEMGFSDEASNITALQATNGNVNRAIERLLG